MAKHSRGVALNQRAAGPHRYREESNADGGRRKMRRAARRAERNAWVKELAVDHGILV